MNDVSPTLSLGLGLFIHVSFIHIVPIWIYQKIGKAMNKQCMNIQQLTNQSMLTFVSSLKLLIMVLIVFNPQPFRDLNLSFHMYISK